MYLLNKFEYLKSFVYKEDYLVKKDQQEVLIIEISARKIVNLFVLFCFERHSIYEHKKEPGDFEFVPLRECQIFSLSNEASTLP